MHCENVNNNASKILGTHFSYNEKLKEEKKPLHDSNKYSTITENMENEKSCTRRKNCYFPNINVIQNSFSIFDNNPYQFIL